VEVRLCAKRDRQQDRPNDRTPHTTHSDEHTDRAEVAQNANGGHLKVTAAVCSE
jgi:hypothetical protein